MVNTGAVPSLIHLTIKECYELRMLPQRLQHVITTLQELRLFRMPDHFNLRVQQDEGEDQDKIQHICSVITFHHS